ncbi:MAG: DUF134 domain-containing protein [Actinomycetota bacterium]|nr:DUF134 domain-containing protein [Actinomycetota bacterium]
MPRPVSLRYVGGEPSYSFFKPRGIPLRELEVVNLSVEELESLKLVDIEGLYHEEAAMRMEVSRSTFHRILKEARRKVAEALVEGKALSIKGGNYILAGDTRIFECLECGYRWEEPFGSGVRACEAVCPKCGGAVVRKGCGGGRARRGGGSRRRGGLPAGGTGQQQ